MEPVEVRLARIEEGMVALHAKIATNHGEVMGALEPVVKSSQRHHDDLIVLKRDRFWLFTIAGTALTAAGYAVLEFIGIHKT